MTDKEVEEFYAKRTMTIAVNDAVAESSGMKKKKKTNVRDTSKKAYQEEKPKLGKKQQELYITLFMAKRPLCDAEIAKYLGWTSALVSARRNELMEMGKVVEAGKGVYPPTGKTVICWKAL